MLLQIVLLRRLNEYKCDNNMTAQCLIVTAGVLLAVLVKKIVIFLTRQHKFESNKDDLKETSIYCICSFQFTTVEETEAFT